MLWHYLREGWHILLTLQCKCFDSANVSFRTNIESWQIHSAEKPPGWYIIHPQRWSLTTFFFFFLLVWKHRENHRVYGYSSMWNREIDLVLIYFSWEDCKKAILSLLLKANSKKCPTRWNEPAIVLLLQCTVCWIKKGLLIWHLGKFAGE